MAWNRLRSILRAQKPSEIDDFEEFEAGNEPTIPINIEEARIHDYPSEPNLDVLPDGTHSYHQNNRPQGFLSVPGGPNLRRTASLDTKSQYDKNRAPSICSLISADINSEGSLKISQLSLSRKSSARKYRPVREIFYREESSEATKEVNFSGGGIELSSLQQVHEIMLSSFLIFVNYNEVCLAEACLTYFHLPD